MFQINPEDGVVYFLFRVNASYPNKYAYLSLKMIRMIPEDI